MSKFKFSPEFLRELQELAIQCGKTAGERAAQESGSPLQMDFRDIEQLAAVVAAGVSEGTATALLDKQTQTLTDQQPCPECGTSCPLNYQDRPLTLDSGQVILLHEPICHCPTCKRDFFPPADVSGTR
jgi:hypothetical protein